MSDTRDIDGFIRPVTFDEWYASVNRLCMKVVGLGINDLPDGPSWSNWDGEITPKDYLRDHLIDNCDLPQELHDEVFAALS